MKHTSWIPVFFLLALHVAAAPLDVWYWRNPAAPQGNTLKGIAYGNGRFVAVGEGGTILISSNGADWDLHLRFDESGFGIPMNAVAFGNGVFVTTRNYYGTWVSTNGVDWVRTAGPATDSVVFCGGNFRAGFYSSSNGINWQPEAIPVATRLNSAASGNGTTIVVGDSGTIATTTNGVDWLAVNSGATQDLMTATFDGQRFFAAGWHGALFVSSNGIDWVNRSVGDSYYSLASASMNGVAAFAGYSYSRMSGDSFTLIPTNDPAGINGMTAANGEFWAVGEGGRMLHSANGLNWSEIFTRLNLPTYMAFNGVAFDGTKFLAGGWSYMFTSTNGVKWTQLQFPWQLLINDIAWGNGRFVAAGADLQHPLGQPIGSSPDGTNWVLHSIPTNVVNQFRRVFFLNGRFIAVGEAGRVATSVNGMDWIAQTLGTNMSLDAVAYGEGKYLVGGATYWNPGPQHSVLYSSPDLVTWTSNYVSIAEGFWDMTYGRGLFLAAYIRSGWPEGLMWSRDGVHWTSQSGFAERVIYRNGVFVIAGVNNISTGFTGRDFRQRNRMFNQVPNGIAFGNGTYVVVGTEGMIIQSGFVPPAFMLSVEYDNPILGPLLRLDSPIDAAYDVQSSSDGTSWNTFTTLQSTNGAFELRDTNRVGNGMKLYRAILP